jgi:hypothetical protein
MSTSEIRNDLSGVRMDIDEVLQQGAGHSTAMLGERLRIFCRPLPRPSEPDAFVRVLI